MGYINDSVTKLIKLCNLYEGVLKSLGSTKQHSMTSTNHATTYTCFNKSIFFLSAIVADSWEKDLFFFVQNLLTVM